MDANGSINQEYPWLRQLDDASNIEQYCDDYFNVIPTHDHNHNVNDASKYGSWHDAMTATII